MIRPVGENNAAAHRIKSNRQASRTRRDVSRWRRAATRSMAPSQAIVVATGAGGVDGGCSGALRAHSKTKSPSLASWLHFRFWQFNVPFFADGTRSRGLPGGVGMFRSLQWNSLARLGRSFNRSFGAAIRDTTTKSRRPRASLVSSRLAATQLPRLVSRGVNCFARSLPEELHSVGLLFLCLSLALAISEFRFFI
jgi:hypothetical protein